MPLAAVAAGGLLGAAGVGGLTLGSGLMAGAAVGGMLSSSDAAENAAQTQANAADQATALQRYIYNTSRRDQAPYRRIGTAALRQFANQSGVGGRPDYSRFYADPGYRFRLDEGNKAVERSAAARGGLLSGATLKALTRYSQGIASQEYGNYTNRLASLAGIGQTATNATNVLGQNYANQAGENMMGAANARASGYIGSANAINSGISQGLNYYQNSQLINRLGSGGNYNSGAGLAGASKPWWDITSGPRTIS